MVSRQGLRRKPEVQNSTPSVYALRLDGMQDLDEVWDDRDELREVIVGECEGLLRLIGVDEVGIKEWRTHHNLDIN